MNVVTQEALGTDKMIVRKANYVGWMIFNNPRRRNAVSMDMWRAVAEIIQGFQADDDVRVAVMMGAGDEAFVSGADISEFEKARATATYPLVSCQIPPRHCRALMQNERKVSLIVALYQLERQNSKKKMHKASCPGSLQYQKLLQYLAHQRVPSGIFSMTPFLV